MSDPQIWEHIIKGLFAILALLIGYGFRILMVWYKNKDSRRFTTALASVKNIYTELGDLRRGCGASRALIVKGHNGGGKPKLSGGLFASVCYGDWSAGMGDAMEWQKQRLDAGYVSVLNDMLSEEQGLIYVETEKLPEGSQLRDILSADSVAYSMFAMLVHKDDYLLFLCLNFSKDVVLDAGRRSRIRLGYNTLQQILRSESLLL